MGRGALTFRLPLPVAAANAFAWHERPGTFERLAPPWRAVRVLERTGGIRDGARVTLDLGFPAGTWRLEHHGYTAGHEFHDRQLSGPFARYEHAHRFVGRPEGCVLEDQIEWRLPLGPLAAPAHAHVRHEFERLFAWRHHVTRWDLDRLASAPARLLRVGVTGASGFIGRALCVLLAARGHAVVPFVRGRAARPGEIAWDPAAGSLDPAALGSLDAVVHLAGAGIADAPWTESRKRELIDSRVLSTETLARALARTTGAPPGPAARRVLVSASAVGWYGDRGDERLDERSDPGHGFLAGLARRWEEAAEPARAAGLRVVHPRTGVVLWPRAGALAKLTPPYAFGVGGPIGDPAGWLSWITLHDLLDALLFALESEHLVGAFNAVAPVPARQADLARALGGALGRPAWTPVPAFALRALLGRERADEMLLASQRAVPSELLAAGFRFRDPELAPALARLFGVPRARPD